MIGAAPNQSLEVGALDEQIIQLLARAGGGMRKHSIFDRLASKPSVLQFNVAFDRLRTARQIEQDRIGLNVVYRLSRPHAATSASEIREDAAQMTAMQRARLRRSIGAASAESPVVDNASPVAATATLLQTLGERATTVAASADECGAQLKALDLARRLGDCCEGHAPAEVIAALATVLASTAVSIASHSAGITKVLGVVNHHAYDGAMTLLATREARH